MTRTFFIVTNEDAEPELFGDSREAFEYMKVILMQYGERYGFSDVQICEAIDDMSEMYSEGDCDFFAGGLGECQVCCYPREVRL